MDARLAFRYNGKRGIMYMGIIIPLLLGWLAGYAVNYLSDVLPRTRRFSQPACLNCETPQPWVDYLLFRKCEQCGQKKSWRVWAFQVIMTALSVFIWINPPYKLGYLLGLLLLTYLAVVFVIDLEHRLILHPVSIFGAVLGLGLGILLNGIGRTLLGGAAGFGIMLVFYLLGVLFARLRARRLKAAGQPVDDEEALGAGDVILAGVLGLIVGWPLIWGLLLMGILLGGAVSLIMVIIMLVSRRYVSLMTFIPYGPFFIISAVLLVYFPKFVALVVPT
jgi:prepilin signal peptidase PulO-like enzyme (type II secretory pathway)